MAYAFVANYTAANSSSGGAITVSVTYAVHDRSIVEITYGSGTDVTETISDGTNTYSAKLTKQNIGGDSQTYSLYECKDCAAGTFTLSFTPGTNQAFRGVSAFRYSGLDNTTNAQAVSNLQLNPGTSTDAVTSTSITPASQPGAMIATTTDDLGNCSTATAGTGFTSQGTITNWDSTLGVISRLEDIRLTSTSAKSATFTIGGVTNNEMVTFAVFIPESGGATAKLRQNSILNGLGASGPFFTNSLG